MAVHPQPVTAPGRVLATLNEDGSRRWIRPTPSPGRWFNRRRITAYALMFVFFVIPYLRMNGRPLVLLDLPRREFSLFGMLFLPTDTVLFMLLMISTLIAIFFVTAMLGRVWCGWGCPQTVYMEFLFRPLEYLIEGGHRGVSELDKRGGLPLRRALKYAVFGVIAIFLAHTFLAYFVGVEALAHWVRRSPFEHPTSFIVMAGVTAAIFFDFAYFREQTCLVACPYGRLQSVLLDRKSLIVGYDTLRGEPRGKGGRDRDAGLGDCVDCHMCVRTCPTGIDIRDGLQMECLHCTQCMDACDSVMVKIGKPEGLIRYGSRDGLERRSTSWLRPRVVIYPIVLSITLGLFFYALLSRTDTEVTMLRGLGAPYQVEADGQVANQIRIKVRNRTPRAHDYRISLVDAAQARLIAPINPMRVESGAMQTTTVFVILPHDAFEDGQRAVTFRVDDGGHFATNTSYQLLGPQEHDEHEGGKR